MYQINHYLRSLGRGALLDTDAGGDKMYRARDQLCIALEHVFLFTCVSVELLISFRLHAHYMQTFYTTKCIWVLLRY